VHFYFYFKDFLVLFYFIAFTLKCFALAVSAEIRATLQSRICKILQFLCRFVNSAHNGQSCTKSARAQSQNSDILNQYVFEMICRVSSLTLSLLTHSLIMHLVLAIRICKGTIL